MGLRFRDFFLNSGIGFQGLGFGDMGCLASSESLGLIQAVDSRETALQKAGFLLGLSLPSQINQKPKNGLTRLLTLL